MKWRSLLAVGLLSLAVGLVLRLPAAVAVEWIEAAVPGLSVAGVSGTALEGRAARVLYRDLPLQQVTWQWQPWALLRGQLAATIGCATDSGRLHARVARALSGALQATEVTGSASLGWLAQRAGYTFIPITGLLQINLERIVVSPQAAVTAITGEVRARGLRWQLLKPPPPLGGLTASLRAPASGTTVIEITDSDGALAIQGQARLSPGGVYQFDLRLRARPEADPRLVALLSELGRPDAEGWYRIAERGQL